MIISHELPPGSLIDEARLVEELGCSRTPLREAFLHLQHENLVEVLPRRAIAVSNVSIFDLQQNFEARIQIETAAARLATERVKEATLRDIENLAAQLAIFDGSASPMEITVLDMGFHRRLVEAADNKYLLDAYTCIQGPAQRIAIFAYSRGPFVPLTVDEHRPVIEALQRGDSEGIAQHLASHIQNGKERILKLL